MTNTYGRGYKLLITALLVFILNSISSNAANYVTVATIGGRPGDMDKSQSMQKAVDEVIAFWKGKINQVLPNKPDLIVLPEGCDGPGGLTTEEKIQYRRTRKTQVQDFFSSLAKANQCYIAFGSVSENKNGGWNNSCVILDRNGNEAGVYYKNYPTIGEMQAGIRPGSENPLIKCDFGTVACAICFDLNFPELNIANRALKPDIILFPSMYHGGLVQAYWAYTCRSYFVGAVGFRELPSEIRDPFGDVIASSTNYYDYAVARINLDRCQVHLDDNWTKLKSLKNKYGNLVTIKVPAEIGSVLITSEDNNIIADQMVKEFGIELLDDYFDRSRRVRQGKGVVGSK